MYQLKPDEGRLLFWISGWDAFFNKISKEDQKRRLG
jgi:hypothetical protein